MYRTRRLKALAQAIGFFDSVRAGRLHSTDGVQKKLKSIVREKDLMRVKRDFLKVVEPVRASSKSRNLIRMLTVLQLITFQYFSLVLVIIMATMFRSPPEWAASFAFLFNPIVMFVMLTLSISFMTGKWFVERKISQAKESTLKLESRRKAMKELAQKYIDQLSMEVRKYNEDPLKYKFKVMYSDYPGIKIVNRPSFFADSYIAVVTAEHSAHEDETLKSALRTNREYASLQHSKKPLEIADPS
jgi:fumarate reductase subunit C